MTERESGARDQVDRGTSPTRPIDVAFAPPADCFPTARSATPPAPAWKLDHKEVWPEPSVAAALATPRQPILLPTMDGTPVAPREPYPAPRTGAWTARFGSQIVLMRLSGPKAEDKGSLYDPHEFVEQQVLSVEARNPYQNSSYSPFDEVRGDPGWLQLARICSAFSL